MIFTKIPFMFSHFPPSAREAQNVAYSVTPAVIESELCKQIFLFEILIR